MEKFFVEENKLSEIEELSPLQQYKLTIKTYKTRDGCWNYTRGIVRRIETNDIVCDIKRNYSEFNHAFFKKDGCEWIVSGRSYMRQVFINLDTGEEYNNENDESLGNNAYCWRKMCCSEDGITLAVQGCVWGGGDDIVFIDISNMKSDHETIIEKEGNKNSVSGMWKYINMDGNIDVVGEIKMEWCDNKFIIEKGRIWNTKYNKYDDDLDEIECDYMCEMEKIGKHTLYEELMSHERIILRRNWDIMEKIEHWKSKELQEAERIRREEESNEGRLKVIEEYKKRSDFYKEMKRMLLEGDYNVREAFMISSSIGEQMGFNFNCYVTIGDEQVWIFWNEGMIESSSVTLISKNINCTNERSDDTINKINDILKNIVSI